MFTRLVGLATLLAMLSTTARIHGATIPVIDDPEGQVTRLEYFYDTDPGMGNGVPIDFTADAEGHLRLNLDLPLDGLDVGNHQLFIRAQNGRNAWSIVSKHAFFLTPFATKAPPSIEKGEYFLGDDPGLGKGIAVEPNEPVKGAVTFPIHSPPLPPGYHALSFRAQDSSGNWSMPVKQTVFQIPDMRVTSVEWSVLEGEKMVASGAQSMDPPASRFSTQLATPLTVDETFTERSFQAQARLILEDRIPTIHQQFDLQIQALGEPLRIITPPQNQTVSVGDQLRLNLVVNQAENLSFQWFKDGVEIPGATSATFTLQTIGLADAGRYAVSISDGVQEVLSDAAIVQVSSPVENAPPVILLIGDADIKLRAGETYTEPGYTATDPEEGDLTGKVLIEGEVNRSVPGTYVLNYSVSDQQGLSATATRTVQVIASEISILSGPVSNDANGNKYYLLSTASWTESEAFARELGGHLATIRNASEQEWIWETFGAFGGTERSLWIGLNDQDQEGSFQWGSGEAVDYTHWLDGQPDENPSSGGEDYVHIIRRGNAFDAAPGYWNDLADTDAVFDQFSPIHGVVEIVGLPSLLISDGVSVTEGESFELSVQVSGTGPIHYLWTFNGQPLEGASQSTLTIPSASSDDKGIYRVEVSNAAGSVLSDPIEVQVNPLPVTNTKPTIILLGETTIRINLGDVFQEPGFIASDEEDGDLNNAVTISGMVDTSSHGTYSLEYSVTDAGGLTTVVAREVIVRAPSTAPPGMVFIEDLGPVGIGNDSDNLNLVSINSFNIDIHEITKGLWDQVREWGLENGYGDLSEGRAGGDGDATHPVTEVSWLDAVKWCNARSEMEGVSPAYYLDEGLRRVYRSREEVMLHVDRSSGYRLPTLLEWEKAARGNQYANQEKNKGYDFPWASNEKTPEDANYWPSLENTTPVGSYSPNAYGLYDMSGNVWEFCWDPITTSLGEIRLTQRYMRGGGWDLSSQATVYSQFTPPVDDKYNFLGFRTVLPPGLSDPIDEHDDFIVTLLPPTNEVPSYRLAWESMPGASYIVEAVNELGESWAATDAHPVLAVSDQTEWVFDITGASRFFRVRTDGAPSGGDVKTVLLKPFPQDGAFGIPQLASISMDLPEHDSIDASTIRFTVGSLGTFDVSDDALSFAQGILTFDPSLAGALGDPESMVSAQIRYADQQGTQYGYDWSFRIQKQTILSGEVFVLGSPQAQFQGQSLNPHQQAIYDQLGMSPSSFAIRQQTGNAPWSLETVTDDSLVFSYQGDTPPNFKVGQFLANLTPAKKDEIFYRKVAVVLKDVPEKQKVTVFTEDVGLLEIFVQASMLSHPVGFPAAAYAIAQEGFLVNASQGYLLESPIEETWSPEEGVDLTLSGNVSIEPKLSLSLDIQGSTVEDFYLRQEGRMTTSLGASLKVTESHQWKTETEDPIYAADRVFYLGQVGVVPIWLDMEFEVNAEAEASYEASGEISTGIQKTYDYWSELVYSSRNPSLTGMFASPPSRQVEVTPLNVTIEGHAEAAVRLVPELSMELESLFGVRVDLTPEVGLKGDVTFANDKMETAVVELYGRLDLNAGLSIEGIDDDLLPEIEPIELVYFPWKFLHPDFPFEITQQPEGGRFTDGEDVSLSVEVAVLHDSFDPGELRYQWFKDGALLSNQTEPELSITQFSEAEAGEYWVEIWKDGEEERVISDIVRIAEGIRWGDARLVELKTIKGTSTVDFSEFTVSKPPQDLVVMPSINWNRLTSDFNPIAHSYDHELMKSRLGPTHWLSQLELEDWEDFLRALGFDENDALPSRFVIPDRSGVKPEAMSLGEMFTYLSTNLAASKKNDLVVRINPHSEIKPTFVYEIYVIPDGEVPTFTGSGGGFGSYVAFDATQGNPDENPWTVLRRTAAVTFEDDQIVLEENDGPSVFGIADGNGLVTNPIDLSHPLDLGLVKHASYQSGSWSILSDTFTPSGIHTYDYEVTVYVVADDEDQTDQWYLDQFQNLVQELR